MAKVFRIHNGADGIGWFASQEVTPQQLNTILTNDNSVATSVPSPFAQMDLVKSAFDWVAQNGIDGTTDRHKLVSNALDVAQLFFMYPRYKNKFHIVAWDPQTRLTSLINDNNTFRKEFAKTLSIFWQQDANIFNFNLVNRLYFIINQTNNLVVGGTSPATLFFAAPDAQTNIQPHTIHIGDDTLFDGVFFPLHKRRFDFFEYFYMLSLQNNFQTFFPEVFNYIEVCFASLNPNQQGKLSALVHGDINNLPQATVLNLEGNNCEVLNIPLRFFLPNPQTIEDSSDFVIKSDFEDFNQVWNAHDRTYTQPLTLNSGRDFPNRPLCLPNVPFNQQWIYTTPNVFWNQNYNINDCTNKSVLPYENDNYPWLTIKDFIYDEIIKLPYPIDNHFFETCGSKKFLLPLKPLFFEFFSVENINNYVQIEDLETGGVILRLKLPVKNGFIEYAHTYVNARIEELTIHLAILPFLKTDLIDLDYTFGIINYNSNNNIRIETSHKGKTNNINNGVARAKTDNGPSTIYFRTTKKFDVVRFGIDNRIGVLIPKLKQCNGNSSAKFAVDFGTTNTHIEYKIDGNAEQVFTNEDNAPIWQSIIDRSNQHDLISAETGFFDKEILPYNISNSNKNAFPLRTCITYSKTNNYQNINTQEMKVFQNTNNFLLFERKFLPNHLVAATDLKWNNYAIDVNRRLIEAYLENLLKLCLYKTLLSGCNPKQTQIIWFYPVSMDGYELQILKDTWSKKFQTVFNNCTVNNIKSIPESIAPYIESIAQNTGLTFSVDIGGGSTDVALFKDNNSQPLMISSFKFAGNALFGDGYSSPQTQNNASSNGFVLSYKTIAEDFFVQEYDLHFISSLIIDKTKKSNDFMSLLFSIENDNLLNINISELIRADKQLKLPILIFHAAICFYNTVLLKKGGFEIPKNILYSGNASKTLSLIDPSPNKKMISKMYKFFFESIFENPVHSDFNIILSDNPKEKTCKGGLKFNGNFIFDEISTIYWPGIIDNNSMFWSEIINKNNGKHIPKYSDIDDSIKESVENSLVIFYQILDKFIDSVNIDADFGIDNNIYDSLFKDTRAEGIKDLLMRGIDAFYRDSNRNIEETLFFYPLIGYLNTLSFKIYQNRNTANNEN